MGVMFEVGDNVEIINGAKEYYYFTRSGSKGIVLEVLSLRVKVGFYELCCPNEILAELDQNQKTYRDSKYRKNFLCVFDIDSIFLRKIGGRKPKSKSNNYRRIIL